MTALAEALAMAVIAVASATPALIMAVTEEMTALPAVWAEI